QGFEAMGKPRVLVLTTAYHHRHRFRLHSFLPHLLKYVELDVIDVPLLSYDKREDEPLLRFLSRVFREVISSPIKLSSDNSVDIYTIRAHLPGDFGALASTPLLKCLLTKIKRKYHAVLATPFLAGFLALISRKHLSGAQIIYEDVDRFYDFFKNPSARLFAKAVEHTTIRSADAVIAASPHLYIEDVILRNGRNTYFVPNGVEYDRLRKASERVKERERYSIVYVGAVEWWSGLDVAVKALKLVTRELRNAKLYVIGEHRTRFGLYLQRLIKELDLSNNVVFLGRKPYDFVVNFLPRCRVGISTFPRSEVMVKAFPYKILEYCASGTPVVMTDVTALSWFVKRYGAGYVHEVGDVEGLAASIIELITDDELWRERSKNAIKLASMFDIKVLAKLEARIIASLGGYSLE
ncbi:MAG: glycosyltransferase, partial [Infirmifilum sp.]